MALRFSKEKYNLSQMLVIIKINKWTIYVYEHKTVYIYLLNIFESDFKRLLLFMSDVILNLDRINLI